MGIRYQPETYQDKDIHDDPQFAVQELLNYEYTVLTPEIHLFQGFLGCDWGWVKAEFQERLKYQGNPGQAWTLRKKLWSQFIEEVSKKFSYTYGNRLAGQIDAVIHELRTRPNSRQLFMSIWDRRTDIGLRAEQRRIPCSLGYWLVKRNDKIHLTYLQRSSDYYEHFVNDVCLAMMMQQFIANVTETEKGNFTHWIGSLHVFAKDVEHVF